MEFALGERRALTPEEQAHREQAQQRIKDSADPRLLRRVDRWIHHHMVPLNPKLPMALRPQATHFDRLSDWYAGYLGVRAEFEPPYELQRDLKERVPQSLLRDIYRPVRGQSMIEPNYHELNIDPGGRRALEEGRAALRREPLPTIESSLIAFIAEQRRRRRFLSRPWIAYRADSAPRHHTAQDHIRFNEAGDDDDDE